MLLNFNKHLCPIYPNTLIVTLFILTVSLDNTPDPTAPCRSINASKPKSNCVLVNHTVGDYSAAAGDTYITGLQRGGGYFTPTQSYHPYRR